MALFELKCWSNLSPIKIKLTLILIIAIPYCLALITAVTILALIEPSDKNNSYYVREARVKLLDNYVDEDNFNSYDETYRKKPIISIQMDQPISNKTNMNTVLGIKNLSNILINVNFKTKNKSLPSIRMKREDCLCSTSDTSCVKDNETSSDSKYPFISAITEILFLDSINESRLKCVGTNINEYLVLTSGECFQKNQRKLSQFNVKIGCSEWSSDYSSHTIKKIIYPNVEIFDGVEKTPALILLNEKISTSIATFSEIVNVSLANIGTVNLSTYFWKSSYLHPLIERLRHEKLSQTNLILRKCLNCFGKNRFCAEIQDSGCSNHFIYSGFPLFFENKMVGIQISSFCQNERREICFVEISKYFNWIKHMNFFFGTDNRVSQFKDFNFKKIFHSVEQSDTDTFFQNVKSTENDMSNINSNTEPMTILHIRDIFKKGRVLKMFYKKGNVSNIIQDLEEDVCNEDGNISCEKEATIIFDTESSKIFTTQNFKGKAITNLIETAFIKSANKTTETTETTLTSGSISTDNDLNTTLCTTNQSSTKEDTESPEEVEAVNSSSEISIISTTEYISHATKNFTFVKKVYGDDLNFPLDVRLKKEFFSTFPVLQSSTNYQTELQTSNSLPSTSTSSITIYSIVPTTVAYEKKKKYSQIFYEIQNSTTSSSIATPSTSSEKKITSFTESTTISANTEENEIDSSKSTQSTSKKEINVTSTPSSELTKFLEDKHASYYAKVFGDFKNTMVSEFRLRKDTTSIYNVGKGHNTMTGLVTTISAEKKRKLVTTQAEDLEVSFTKLMNTNKRISVGEPKLIAFDKGKMMENYGHSTTKKESNEQSTIKKESNEQFTTKKESDGKSTSKKESNGQTTTKIENNGQSTTKEERNGQSTTSKESYGQYTTKKGSSGQSTSKKEINKQSSTKKESDGQSTTKKEDVTHGTTEQMKTEEQRLKFLKSPSEQMSRLLKIFKNKRN